MRDSLARIWGRRFPLYPVAYPVVFVGLIWSSVDIHPAFLIRPLIVGVSMAVLVTAGLVLIARDPHRGAFLGALLVANLVLDDSRLLLASIVVAGLVVLELVVWRGRLWRFGPTLTRVMNAVSLTLLVLLAITVAQNGAIGRAIDEVSLEAADRSTGEPSADAPDIYVILLDAFPGDRATPEGSAATDAFGEALRTRGFSVQDDSHSNYTFTAQTLASMFSMRHLHDIDGLGPPFRGSGDDSRRLRRAMADGAALRELSARGYELVGIPSGFDHADMRGFDRRLEPPQPGEFEIFLLGRTPLGHVIEWIAPDFLSGLHRDRVHDTFRLASAVANEDSGRPRMLLAHVPAPHAPWVFGPGGEPRSARTGAFFSDDPGELGIDAGMAFERSQDQADYIAVRATALVDEITSGSRRPAVIVVLSDHGTGLGMDADDYRNTDLVERFSNFLAVRAPGHPEVLDERLSPVNVFPRLLNAYFGTTFDETDDGTYAWGDGVLDTFPLSPVPAWEP